MANFVGRHAATVTVRASPAAAAAAFADLDRQIACHPELASAEKRDANTLAVRMKEMSHGPVRFAGAYTLHFTRDGNVVKWRTEAGNVDVQGSATFVSDPGGSRFAYTESVTLNLDVNAILGRVLRPMVEAMMARGMKGFVERMAAELDRA